MTRGRSRRGHRPALAAVLPVLLLATVLTACSLLEGEDTAGAERLADRLADALTTRKLGGVPVDGVDQALLDEVLPDGLAAEVEAVGVEVEDERATATLRWTWDTPGRPWSYETAVDLARTDEAWRATWRPAVVEPSLVEGERLDTTTLAARRGDILGAGDEPIVTNRPVVRFGIDKTKVPSGRAATAARALAVEVGVDPEPYAERVRAAGREAFVEAIVLREEDAAGVSVEGIRGAVGLGTEMPLAPTREFAAPLLGRVGEATAEVVAESGGEVEAGDVVGLSGLQARYDDRLAGVDGLQVQAVGGTEERVLFSVDQVDGRPLRTTLDVELQSVAEGVLAQVGPPSALVAIRPSSGDLLAAASGPGSEGLNTATFGQYAPGSTFKVVTSLALLRTGLRPTDVVPCTPTVTVDGREFENYDDYPSAFLGDVPLRTAVAQSCNTAFISQHERLGDRDLAEAAAALGLGVDHDLGFPAYFGSVPTPGSLTGKAASMIGQGQVLASPMAMATVAASVVRGEAVLPRLLVEHEVAHREPSEPLTPQEATALRGLMRAVVTDGSGSFLADVPGSPVGAKTGTAEYGTEEPPRTHAWMIATRGDLAVAVLVETGDSGSGTAGPLVERFLRGVG